MVRRWICLWKPRLTLIQEQTCFSSVRTNLLWFASRFHIQCQTVPWLDYKYFVSISQTALLLQQPPYTPSFNKYFTTERQHCPGPLGRTLKEWTNEITAHIAQREEDEDSLTQLHPGKVQTAEMMLPTGCESTLECIWAIPGSCHPCSPCSLPFARPENPQHSLSSSHCFPRLWHHQSLLSFPPFLDTTHIPALPLRMLSTDYKLFQAKMIFYYVLVQCPEKWGSHLKALP